MKVRIYKPHTHAGTLHHPGPDGIDLDVSETDAVFLQAAGVLDGPQPVETIGDSPTEALIQKPRGARRNS